MLGTIVGGYRIITELGSGGMGTVYYAEHQLIGRRAAIKVLNQQVSRDEEVVSRFLTEARAANDIRHPNVVSITDMGKHEGVWFIVMDLLEGETLGERLERTGRCDERTTLRIARQVASALGAAHERNIVHRDLKPENIFLTNHPDLPDHVKLLDFGIAKLIGAAERVDHHTQAGAILGTPAYMSPEQCRGEANLDHRSDIYSMGIVLYEMLTGAPPFRRENLAAIIVAHAIEEPKPPRLAEPSISPHVSAAILRALEKDPSRRFNSMQEMRDALDDRQPVEIGATPLVAPSTRPLTVEERRVVEMETRAARPVVDRMTQIVLDRLNNDRLVLPAMPGVALECLTAVRDPKQTFGKVAASAGRDPLLAGRVLRLANSAAFPSRLPAVTLEQAIARMGVDGLTIALVEFSLEDVFSSKNDRIGSAFNGIWEHSVATALLAKDLVLLAPPGAAEPNGAYLAGLLHDIGKPVVGSLLLEAERVVSQERSGDWMDESVWKRVVAGSHREVGRALAAKWNLPGYVQEAISNACDYDASLPRSTANFVRLANALAKREGVYVGDVDQAAVFEAIGAGRTLMGLDQSTLDRACQNLRTRVGTLVKPHTPTRRVARPEGLASA